MTSRRPASRSTAMISLAVVIALIAGTGGTGSSSLPSKNRAVAESSGRTFLRRYVHKSGRVVRVDQGGDTVSEGQAYGLLLAFATGQRGTFLAIWRWSERHLAQRDGLLASSWRNGRVVDHNAAADADLDVARALLLAAQQWHDPSLGRAGRRYAAAIQANETVAVGTQRILVAGPWGRTAPYWVNPSYFDPATFALLQAQTGDRRWGAVASSSERIVGAMTHGGRRLPANWARVDRAGRAKPSGAPRGGPVLYGYDSFRVLVRQAEGCASPGRRLDVQLLHLTARTVSPANRGDTYHLDATVASRGDNPELLVAAAAAAQVAGLPAQRDRYLRTASSIAQSHPSYYLDAWVALGWFLLSTHVLGGCGACNPPPPISRPVNPMPGLHVDAISQAKRAASTWW